LQYESFRCCQRCRFWHIFHLLLRSNRLQGCRLSWRPLNLPCTTRSQTRTISPRSASWRHRTRVRIRLRPRQRQIFHQSSSYVMHQLAASFIRKLRYYGRKRHKQFERPGPRFRQTRRAFGVATRHTASPRRATCRSPSVRGCSPLKSS
jgi:hypothetical protein